MFQGQTEAKWWIWSKLTQSLFILHKKIIESHIFRQIKWAGLYYFSFVPQCLSWSAVFSQPRYIIVDRLFYPCVGFRMLCMFLYFVTSNREKKSALTDEVICSIAERLNKTPAQVCLKYLVNRGVVPLPKSETPDRIKSNLQVSLTSFILQWDLPQLINLWRKQDGILMNILS